MSLNQEKSGDGIENDRHCTYCLLTKKNDRRDAMPVNLYYTQRIRGFQQISEKYSGESATFILYRSQQRCPRCSSVGVVATPLRRRSIISAVVGRSALSSPCIAFTVRTARPASWNISRFCLTPRPVSPNHWSERSLNCGLT